MKNRSLALVLILLCLGVACNTDPNVAKRKYVETGNRYYDKGRYKEALIMYRNALKKDLKYGEAYYRAALSEIKLLRYQEAARDLHRAVELQPDNLDAYTRLINIYLNAYLGDRRRPKAFLTELKSLSDKLAKKDPNSFEFVRVSGYLALTDQKVKDAINFFEKANRLKPLEPDVVLVYIQALAADGRQDEALKLGYEMLKKDPHLASVYDALFLEYLREKKPDEAEKIMRAKVDNNPKVADNYLQLAAHYYSVQNRPMMIATLDRLRNDPKDFPTAPILVGDFFLRLKDADLAIKNYQDGIKQDPKQKHTYQKRIIEALVLKDKKQEAQTILTEILKEDPNDSEAIAIRASLSLLTGSKEQLQSAINDLQTVVSRLPENPVLRFNLGRAHMAKGNLQQAKIQFEEAIKLRPDYLLPRLALGQILQQNGEYPKVIQMVQEILTYDPVNVPARLLRTRALIGMGENKQARTELEQTAAQSPDVSDARLQLAALDLTEKNFKAAEGSFQKLWDKNQDSRALMGLTEVYVQAGNYDKAIKLLEEQYAKFPDRSDIQIAIGNVAARAEQFDKAITHFKKALEKYPRSADLWIRMGEMQRRKGELASAAQSFHKAKDLAPTSVTPYIQLALMLDTEGKKDEAKPMYEQILKIQPDNPIALNNLAFLLAEAGIDLDQALTMAQRARQKLPQDLNVADTLGWIYIKKNLSDPAISIFRDLVQKDPERSTYRYHLAMALMQKGDKPNARKELETALRSKPPKAEEVKIRELITKIG
ncbi:MAG TPA: tetratricopeptide repeat protein [Bryobacteraceae bacterium]|nr:tetratricopeptide repeat protein [Bryobacteraceae bacterium]